MSQIKIYCDHSLSVQAFQLQCVPKLTADDTKNHFPTVSLNFFFPLVSVPLSSDEFDAYIIVSFVNATLVLSIGETVEEVTDSGFLGTTPTLSCSLLGEDALVQVRGFHKFCFSIWYELHCISWILKAT